MISKLTCLLFPIVLFTLLKKTNGTTTEMTFMSSICTPCTNSTSATLCDIDYECVNNICISHECDDDSQCTNPDRPYCIKASCCDDQDLPDFSWSSKTVSSVCWNETCADFYSFEEDTTAVCGADGVKYDNKISALCAGTCTVECKKSKQSGISGFFKNWEKNYFKGNYLYYSIAVLVVIAICLSLSFYCICRKCRSTERKDSVYKIELQNQYSWGNDTGQKRASYQY